MINRPEEPILIGLSVLHCEYISSLRDVYLSYQPLGVLFLGFSLLE